MLVIMRVQPHHSQNVNSNPLLSGDTAAAVREAGGRVVDGDPAAHPPLGHHALPRHQGQVRK